MKYSRRDLGSLLNQLQSASAKWWEIGLQLGLDHGELAAIQRNHPGDVQRCLSEVIYAWLVSSGETTSEQLALALSQPTIREMELAQEIHPKKGTKRYEGKKNLSLKNCTWKCLVQNARVVVFLLFALACSIALFGVLINKSKDGHSSSLPDIKESLIGRETEMQQIMEILSHPEVEVVNLYGLPGFGKSTIAKHIGHAMLKQGMDVHYILVEYLHEVSSLEKELFCTSEYKENATLGKWARSHKKKILIILDNVDGSYWIQDNTLVELKRRFIDTLQSYSKSIKVLITSQKKILGLQRYQSYRLQALDIDNCTVLLQSSLIGTNISNSYGSKICELVGGIPLVIKILASALSQPAGYPLQYVIQRLNGRSKLRFIADQGNRVSKDRILDGLGVSFKSIDKECYYFSLFLVKVGSFTLDVAKDFVKQEMIKQFSDDPFHIEECIYQLSTTSLLEEHSISGEKNISISHYS